jgi:hypothetical protein
MLSMNPIIDIMKAEGRRDAMSLLTLSVTNGAPNDGKPPGTSPTTC